MNTQHAEALTHALSSAAQEQTSMKQELVAVMEQGERSRLESQGTNARQRELAAQVSTICCVPSDVHHLLLCTICCVPSAVVYHLLAVPSALYHLLALPAL